MFSLDVSLIDVRVFISLEINTYPRRTIRRSSNLGNIFGGKSASYRPGKTVCGVKYGIKPEPIEIPEGLAGGRGNLWG
jgi:hypothetical protein